ncbi:MAG: fumarylacetoacetate hydrolase family protein [Oscillospiraceae bacterium]|nr:fumarylacetoacetate hydrolase family protein [Oscillospiraceae bacterium]
MKLIRFIHKGREAYGYLKEDRVEFLQGGIATGFKPTGDGAALGEVKLLSPVMPSKAVCVGQNYLDHIKEMGNEIPTEPVIFLKPPTSVIGPGDVIVRPAISDRVDYEGELAVVIGKQARHLTQENALGCVLGYTCANDVTARDIQQRDGQWTRGKGFDTFLPLGPCIETEIDPSALAIRTTLNGKIVQDSCTDQLLFKIPMLLSFITAAMTLNPGDVVLTGTSSGVGPMVAGDVVAVEIEGIGRLENRVEDM